MQPPERSLRIPSSRRDSAPPERKAETPRLLAVLGQHCRSRRCLRSCRQPDPRSHHRIAKPSGRTLSERLASERHHVRYGVEVDGLKFVAYLPADITKFYCYLIGDLALQREVELMAHARPEIGIQAFACAGGNVVKSGEVRLR